MSQPIGEAFEQWEEQQMQALMEQGARKHTSEAEQNARPAESIRCLYVEIFARLHRESVLQEKDKQERDRDVSREIKVGAVFCGEAGRERSALVPGVFVETPGPIRWTLPLRSPLWRIVPDCRTQPRITPWAMEQHGSGGWQRSNFPEPFRSLRNIMRVNMPGMWHGPPSLQSQSPAHVLGENRQ